MNIVWTATYKHYCVVKLPSGVSDRAYGVWNSTNDVIEYSVNELPQAIATAAQFDYMIEHDTWKGLLDELFEDRVVGEDIVVTLDS